MLENNSALHLRRSFQFLGLLAVGLKKVLIYFPKFIVSPVSSPLGLTVFSFNEAVLLSALFVPLHSMSAGSLVSLHFKILPFTGWPTFSWYNVSIISLYTEMIWLYVSTQLNQMASVAKWLSIRLQIKWLSVRV